MRSLMVPPFPRDVPRRAAWARDSKGLASRRLAPYLSAMGYFSRFNPIAPVNDLRLYFHRRGPIELGFLGAALIITMVMIEMFAINTPMPHREKQLIYVQQWPTTRTDAEIRAQQAKDKPKEDAERARVDAAYELHRQQLIRARDSLHQWGLY